MMLSLVAHRPAEVPLHQEPTAVPILLLAYMVAAFMPNAYELLRRYRAGIPSFVNPSRTLSIFRFRWRPTLIWAAGGSLLVLVAMRKMAVIVPFVYQVF